MDKNCLGKLFLDKGHNLVPEPPQRITGTILFLVVYTSLGSFKKFNIP